MSELLQAPVGREAVPGASIVRRIRRFVVVALVGLLVYSTLSTASRGACPVDGGPGSCVQLELHPSPLIVAVIVGMLLWALTRVVRARGEAQAVRILDRTTVATVVLLAVSALVGQVWFQLIPLPGDGTYVFPFPFASVELQRY